MADLCCYALTAAGVYGLFRRQPWGERLYTAPASIAVLWAAHVIWST